MVELARTWASTRPGFQGIWIDRAQHDGWITLAFTSDDDARQAEAVEEFPNAPIVVVGVDWTRAELDALRRRVREELQPIIWGVGVPLNKGVVGIYLEPDGVAAVEERFAGERVCLTVSDPPVTQPDFPQPISGDGWRLLGDEARGPAYRVGYAADQASYEAMWGEARLTGSPPAVDFANEIVIWFGAVYGSSCPNIRLDEVVFDVDRGLVYAVIRLLDAPPNCTYDARGHAYMVAVERRRLPQGPFWLQLNEDVSSGPAEQRIRVDEDQSLPWPSATATATPNPSAGAVPTDSVTLQRAIEAALADPLLIDYLSRHRHGDPAAAPYFIPRGLDEPRPAILVTVGFDAFADDYPLGSCDIYREVDRIIGAAWLTDVSGSEILARAPIWHGGISCL